MSEIVEKVESIENQVTGLNPSLEYRIGKLENLLAKMIKTLEVKNGIRFDE